MPTDQLKKRTTCVPKRGVIFFGHTQNGNVSRMLGELERALAKIGVSTTRIDTTLDGHVEKLASAIDREDVDFFLSMTGVGLDLRERDNLFNKVGKPFVSCYLDPLTLYPEQVRTPIVRRMITSTSDCDVAYWASIAPDLDIHFLPHAAEPGTPAPWEDRDIAAIFPATGCGDPEDIRRTEWRRHGPKVEAALNAIVEEHLHQPLRPLTDSIRSAAGGTIDMADHFAVYPYFATVDRYLRSHVRWHVLAGLIGLPVTVVGPGWEPFRKRFPDNGFQFTGPRVADDVQDMTRRSKVVVNTCSGYHGSHERVFDAQAAGAVSISTETGWLRKTVPGDAIHFVDFTAGDRGDSVRDLFSRPQDMAAMASRGRAWQAGSHTWRHRAATLLDLLAGKNPGV